MHESDAVALAAFDDEPQLLPPPAQQAEPRPGDRPRPDLSRYPETDPIFVVMIDSEAEARPTANPPHSASPSLAFDVLLFDTKLASFITIFSAGTPLSELKPRTVSISPGEADSPITSIAIHRRPGADQQPVHFLTFRFPRDVRGKRLTLRFADPADLQSLRIEDDSSREELGSQIEFSPNRAEPRPGAAT